MSKQYQERRKEIEEAFERYSKIEGADEEFIAPSTHYKLHVTFYGGGKDYWNYSRGLVTRIADGEVIADVKRNFGHFWHTWVEHPNGNEYLLCGEDYQGYYVVNLTEGKYEIYFPDEGYVGVGFCWTAAYPSPDNLLLAVEGCVWACPYEVVFYDFRAPDLLPYKELGRVSDIMKSEGWRDNETFALSREVEYRKSDAVAYTQLSESEQLILDSDNSLVEYRIEEINVKRPGFDLADQDSYT